jgi:hypothetical protein
MRERRMLKNKKSGSGMKIQIKYLFCGIMPFVLEASLQYGPTSGNISEFAPGSS